MLYTLLQTSHQQGLNGEIGFTQINRYITVEGLAKFWAESVKTVIATLKRSRDSLWAELLPYSVY